MTPLVNQGKAAVEVGTEAKDRATEEVLVAKNAKIAAKVKALAEVKVWVMAKVLAGARDVVRV